MSSQVVVELPSNPSAILLKKKLLRRQPLGNPENQFFNKRIAILGESTINAFKHCLELYLLGNAELSDGEEVQFVVEAGGRALIKIS